MVYLLCRVGGAYAPLPGKTNAKEMVRQMENLKLNLGSGKGVMEGWRNIDIKEGAVAYPLGSIENESVDVVRASHLLEHFPRNLVVDVLKEWVRVLKPGGVLKIAVPNFRWIAENYLAGAEFDVIGYTIGGQTDENDYHKCLFDEKTLNEIMVKAGLEEIGHWKSELDDCASLPVSLNLMARKPVKGLVEEDKPEKEDEGENESEIQTVQREFRCVISKPRIGFTNNTNCIIRELAMRGISCTTGTGAYWAQVLTRIIEEELEKKPDYILTLDYDTWFKYEQVIRLLELIEISGVDAVISNQVRREGDGVLIGTDKTTLSRAEYDNELIPVNTGHFGMTMFRASSLEKLKRPWFIAKPNSEGRWGEGRVDADIYFWNNFKRCGMKAMMAMKVRVGHLQLMCSFAGRFKDGFRAEHRYVDDVEKGLIPNYVLKEIE